MNTDIATAKTDHYRLVVGYDPDATSPRKWDNGGTFLTWIHNHQSPDTNDYSDPNAFREWWTGLGSGGRCVECGAGAGALRYFYLNGTRRIECEECEGVADVNGDSGLILPVYMLDHSGISYSVRNFGDVWDSGQVGWIFAERDTIEKEWDGDRIAAENCLRSEVKVYSDWASGSCWYWSLEILETCNLGGEHVRYAESCGGYYGDPTEADVLQAVTEIADIPEEVISQLVDALDI